MFLAAQTGWEQGRQAEWGEKCLGEKEEAAVVGESSPHFNPDPY